MRPDLCDHESALPAFSTEVALLSIRLRLCCLVFPNRCWALSMSSRYNAAAGQPVTQQPRGMYPYRRYTVSSVCGFLFMASSLNTRDLLELYLTTGKISSTIDRSNIISRLSTHVIKSSAPISVAFRRSNTQKEAAAYTWLFFVEQRIIVKRSLRSANILSISNLPCLNSNFRKLNLLHTFV